MNGLGYDKKSVLGNIPAKAITKAAYALLSEDEKAADIVYYITDDNESDSGVYTKSQVDALLSAKEDTLTFDSLPTSGSSNPVRSSGVYTEFTKRQITNTLTKTEYNALPATDKQKDILYVITDDNEDPTLATSAQLTAHTSDSTVHVTSGEKAVWNTQCIVVNFASFSSLPQTVADTRISEDMVVFNSTLSNPAAQTGDWTVTTTGGGVTVSGNISGSTTLKLVLGRSAATI